MQNVIDKLNRKSAPAINEIKRVEVKQLSSHRLKNGTPVHHINAGTQDLVKIELLFPAGMLQQPIPLVSGMASAMLQEGTAKHSAKEIAEAVDYYGAFLNTEITQDLATIEIHSLNKHLPNVLPVVQDILMNSVFPQAEWDILLQNKKQNYIVNNKKVNIVSRKKFAELIFGNAHPYGYNVPLQDFDKLKKEDSFNFYKSSYTAKDAIIVASGNVTDATLTLLETYFGVIPSSSNPEKAPQHTISKIEASAHVVEIKNALQSAIRVGKVLFTRSHPDFCGMQILNTILGGYFGSRLMANIREDKGYTYGIGSGLSSLKEAGFFSISTEVGVEVTKNTLKEIYFEMEKLQKELVPDEELSLVRNYLLGAFLKSIDGPFALADRFKALYFSGLGYDFLDRYIETVHTITSKQLRDLANKYLQKQDMTELVVGGFGE